MVGLSKQEALKARNELQDIQKRQSLTANHGPAKTVQFDEASDEEGDDESNKALLGSKEDTRDLSSRWDEAEDSEAEELRWMVRVRAVRRSEITQIKMSRKKRRPRFE